MTKNHMIIINILMYLSKRELNSFVKMFKEIYEKSLMGLGKKLNSHNIRNLKVLATRRVRPFYLFQRLYDFNNCKR